MWICNDTCISFVKIYIYFWRILLLWCVRVSFNTCLAKLSDVINQKAVSRGWGRVLRLSQPTTLFSQYHKYAIISLNVGSQLNIFWHIRGFLLNECSSLDMGSDRDYGVTIPRGEPGNSVPFSREEEGRKSKTSICEHCRGKTPSPPWKKKVIVADLRRKIVEVQSKEVVTSSQFLPVIRYVAQANRWGMPDPSNYTSIRLTAREKEVTIYADAETESTPTTKSSTGDGHSNVLLAKFYLNRIRLGGLNQIVRFFGGFSTLYILNVNLTSSGATSPKFVT